MFSGKGSGEVLAVGFTAGFIGAAAVLVFARLLYYAGIAQALGVTMPIAFSPPEVYRPLVWGGLWGIPLGFIVREIRSHYLLVGFLYFLAPVAALYLVFLPMQGMGFFGLNGGLAMTAYFLIVNMPFGIVTTLAAAALSGQAVPRPERGFGHVSRI